MIYYFGTNLKDAGHYFWLIDEVSMEGWRLSFPEVKGLSLPRYEEWPFDPYQFTRQERGKPYLPKGAVVYAKENGYTICAINGSCSDERMGTCSVFFTDEEISFEDFVKKLLAISIIKQMVKQMPFEVKFESPKIKEKMVTLQYFGTSLTTAGHYFWICQGEYLLSAHIRFRDFFSTAFDTENLTGEERLRNGDVRFFKIGKYTICHIEGSCYDTRGNSKSVFFTEDDITFEELVLRIMTIPISRKIIKQCPFEIKWGLEGNVLFENK